jgi:hypothetical protein
MKISDKLYGKYAARSPLLPPEGEEEVVVSIPKHNKAPSIANLTPEELEQWEKFIANKKIQTELEKDLDVTKEFVDLGGEDKAPEEFGTMPAIPKMKQASFSPDSLLKMCGKYYDLCLKF